jgi:hypothetical protein
MNAAADAGITCDHCDRDLVGRVVTLKLDGGAVRSFCSDSCERQWLHAELIRDRRFLRRIWITTRGKARELARVALLTDTPA